MGSDHAVGRHHSSLSACFFWRIQFVRAGLEECDMVELFGDHYRRYKERVSMPIP
jgi:protein-S-isoprenylcysteine O-methyltransferase Ste14